MLDRRIDCICPVSRNLDLLISVDAEVDRLVVHINDILALLQVGLRRSILHVLNSLFDRHDLRKCEESSLKSGIRTLAHADGCSKVDRVDRVQLDVVVCNVALRLSIELLEKLCLIPLAVDQEDTAGLDVIDHLVAFFDVRRVVAGDEVCFVDVVRALDRLVTETKMGNGDTARLLRVILEVSLNVLVGVVADDLDGVLVRTDGTVAAQTPELALDRALGCGIRSRLLFERKVGHIIIDAKREVLLRLILLQFVINCEDRCRRRILRA